MIFPGRLSDLPQGSFAKLALLLEGVPPGAAPVSLAVGDPKGEVPGFITDAIAQHAARFGEYPAIDGTPEWRQARDQYLNHIIVCRSCYAPNGRHCTAGARLRASYDNTPMEAHQ